IYLYLFECIFNPVVKVFVLLFLVSRFHCESESFKMDLILDVCGFDMFDGSTLFEDGTMGNTPLRTTDRPKHTQPKTHQKSSFRWTDETSTEAATLYSNTFYTDLCVCVSAQICICVSRVYHLLKKLAF
uniref:Uncharacterized protein n=1 Tax=Cyprinus carpio TaxID=7962 RepID=A0A8C2ANL4_CYPCA